MSRMIGRIAGLHRLSLRRGVAALALASLGASMGAWGQGAGPKPATPEQWKQIVAAAQKEGSVTYYSATSPQTTERLKADFEKAYPGITMAWQRYGSGQLVTKLDQERSAGAEGADVAVATELGWFEQRVKEKTIRVPSGPAVEGWPAAFLALGTLPILSMEPIVMMYNTSQVKTPVNGYMDLLRPEFKGKIGIEDLAATTVLAFYDWQEKTFGADYLTKLAALQPKVFASTIAGSQMVASGEIAVANFINAGAFTPLAKQGAPVKRVIPNPAWATRYISGIIGWSKRPNAALVLMDYLMSRRGQSVWNGADESASPLPNIPGSLTVTLVPAYDPAQWPPERVSAYRAKWLGMFRK